MAVERINLTFQSDMHGKPILHNLGKQFDVAVNIERANVSESTGWIQITLTGATEEIQRSLAYLNTLGVSVQPVDLAVA